MRIAPLESRPIGVRSAVLTALLAATLLAFAQPARANVAEKIILRCTHNESVSGFSQSAYNQALKELSADTEEYSPCSSLIHQAQLAAAAGAQGGAGAGAAQSATPIAPTPSERRAITHAAHAGSEPVKLDGRAIHPGVVHVEVASALSSLPTPLLAILTFLVVCVLALAGAALRNRVRAGRSD
ncbi:MAG: hypothetical protein ACLPUT_18375 [Solirubrobacteraceae bacterium]|jgi:hypothetical protein